MNALILSTATYASFRRNHKALHIGSWLAVVRLC